MAYLIAGLYQQTAGDIEFDGGRGHRLEPKAWRTNVSMVFQETGIIQGTVRDNLVLGCANITIFLLAKALPRIQEFSLRVALGATPLKIVQQVVGEGMAIAALSIGPMAISSYLATKVLFALLARPLQSQGMDLPVLQTNSLVLLASVGAAVLVVGLFSLVPVLTVALTTHSYVSASSYSLRARIRVRRIWRFVVVGQVALALVLSIFTIHSVKHIDQLTTRDVGFTPESLYFAKLQAGNEGFLRPETMAQTSNLVQTLRGMPGVGDITSSVYVPGAGFGAYAAATSELTKQNISGSSVTVALNFVGERFCTTLRIPVIEGRDILYGDTATSSENVAVLSKSAARLLLPPGTAIGQYIEIQGWDSPFQVVGITQDFVYSDIRKDTEPTVLIPYARLPQAGGMDTMYLAFRLTPGGAVLPSVLSAVKRSSPNLPVARVDSAGEILEEMLGEEILLTRMASVASFLSLVFAAVGIAAVSSYRVAQRRHEIAVRLALGATKQNVTTLVLRDAMLLNSIGIAIGCAGVLALAQLPLTFTRITFDFSLVLAVVATMGIASFVSCLLPALKASDTDVASLLRNE